MAIPFIDLAAQQARIAPAIDKAIKTVLAHGQYILGPEVKAFEAAINKFETAEHTVGCANGTDAIILPMKAWGIGPGDAVFCPSFTYAATAEAIAVLGATPVFVDVDAQTYTLDSASLTGAIEATLKQGTLTPKAIIAVDLFGQPANYPVIKPVAENYGLKLIADGAQGLGCRLDGKSPLEWVDVLTTSFFPAKPLGCYGDGGAMMMRDADLEADLRSLLFHGRGKLAGDHEKIGYNSRLDTIQAAILIEKLGIFDDEIRARNDVAQRYNAALKPIARQVPDVIAGGLSTWAQYTIEVENRDAFMAAVKAKDVPVAAYYPLPTHMQTAYKDFPIAPDGLPVTMTAKDHVAALPMHPYLDIATQEHIIDVVKDAIKQTS